MSAFRFGSVVSVVSLFATTLSAAESTGFTDLDAALAEAKKSGKPVFVYAFDSV